MSRVTLVVVGLPAPQGSKRGFPVKSKATGKVRAVVVEGGSAASRAKVGTWRQDVIDACARVLPEGWRPIDGPVRLSVEFRLPRPPSAPKRRAYPHVAPDLVKLLRATEDAMKLGRIFTDDARVVEIGNTSKHYAGPQEQTGATIVVEELF